MAEDYGVIELSFSRGMQSVVWSGNSKTNKHLVRLP